MNRQKKTLSLLLALILLLSLWMVPNADAHAALTNKQKALKAYKEFLAKPTILIIPNGRRYYNLDTCLMEYYTATPSSEVRFALAYINNDNIPELIVERKENCWRHGLFGIFTYKDGKVKRIKSANGENYYFGCYAKTGTFVTRMITEGTPYHDSYSVFKNGKVITRLEKAVIPPKEVTYYKYRNGRFPSISKRAFTDALKYLTKGKKLTKVSFHKNAAWTRNKYLR